MVDSKKAPAQVYVGLGSNLGDRQALIDAAIARLEDHPAIAVAQRTAAIETAPWGVADQPPFLNAVVELRTTLAPLDLLRELQRIERELGRRPGGARWGPREIDLDILIYDDFVVETPELTVPHPRICEREFVLRQIVELNSGLTHPVYRLQLATFIKPS